ncbi:helicase superfamily 3 domain protein [Lyngbya aestuarii BL J]|uniref:Helicase superfamily 3 domain protein n=1 Tax=Lyngbya aestuarii BL J TaxID=1348334 RepID=U7QLD0_9CYAN|nr:helicase superfamily 3 domain protein [Lyngbya aestuarii BL J]
MEAAFNVSLQQIQHQRPHRQAHSSQKEREIYLPSLQWPQPIHQLHDREI